MAEYCDPKYLSDGDNPTDRVRCPIHGFIKYSPNERLIIDSPYFRRLRHIRQLGLTEYAYPGANHSRFEHSLGVMAMASAMFDSLAAKKGETMEKELKQVPWFAEDTLAKARQVVRLAALLHDTGHPPFSHGAEHMWSPGGHEEWSIKVVKDPEFLGGLIDATWVDGMAEQVANLLVSDESKGDLPPQSMFLKDIISGHIDADRTDYLLRDSHHCGVEYGRFDHRRLIECLTLRQLGGGGVEIAIEADGIHMVEALIMARFQMNAQVYFHRIRRIYDHFLIEYHRSLDKSADGLPRDDVLQLNDVTMMNRMYADASSPAEGWESAWKEEFTGDEATDEAVALRKRAYFAKRILERNHPKVVFQTGDFAKKRDLETAHTVAKALKEKYTDVYVYLDDMGKRTIPIHKFEVPDGDDLDFQGAEFMVIDKFGQEKLVTADSKVLSRIPRGFRCLRLFADVANQAQKEEIEAFVAKVRSGK
jgi:uncharacterized protein